MVFPDASLTVHSRKTSISRLENASAEVLACPFTNLGIRTNGASLDAGTAEATVTLVNASFNAVGSSEQAVFPTWNVSRPVVQAEPCLNVVAQNSGVSTRTALNGSLVAAGRESWARTARPPTVKKTMLQATTANGKR